SYYNRELAYLRRLGAEFAEAHPKIAGRLRLTGDAVEDPHVSRLLEGVAFLNARIRRKLDDEFPELTDALLGQLFPHYLRPIPSMTIVQFRPAADLEGGFQVPAGTEFETEPVGGETSRFRTTQDQTLWPIEIEQASLTGRPLQAPKNPNAPGSVAVLKLSLRCMAEGMSFSTLAPESLRVFLRGTAAEVFQLYELIFNHTVSIALADSTSDPNPVILDTASLRPVGFAPEEGILPYPPRSPLGYRLLTEFFAFPEKFLFFEIENLSSKMLMGAGRKLDIFLYLNNTLQELERNLSADSFALGCVPAVNLFAQRAEPIRLDETNAEYHIVPDSRRTDALEIYSVDDVTATSQTGETAKFEPFFGLKHAGTTRGRTRFWHTAQRPAGGRDSASETYLTFVDLDSDPSIPAEWVASVETTCFNRNLPGKLPFGGGHPYLKLVQDSPAIDRLHCITAPTPTLRLPSRNEGTWRLVSHLTLNHLSLADSEHGAEALREMLRLYDFRDAPETRALIDSVLSVRTTRGVARPPDAAMGALCRGLEVTIEFDDRRQSGAGIFVLAAVLERFIAHYASINAFTRLTATLKGRSGVYRKWPARAGDQPLL
ncbi:MAG TPA: type VI secretion system baseplate subunit TssF, partial [Micropepsaceae bacterium]|nr:type VI secretion system baseplate subunit TssF [Micropepsaceae bacterium]